MATWVCTENADTYEADSYAWGAGLGSVAARPAHAHPFSAFAEAVVRDHGGAEAGLARDERTQRADLADDLTPTLRRRLGDELGELYAQAARLAAADLTDHAESAAAEAIPSTCPFTLEQALDEAWLPPAP